MQARRIIARTIWLMVGAAIGLAAGLLLVSLAQVLVPGAGPVKWLVTAICVAPALLIGLLPGVREIEVVAARTLLGVTNPLLVPDRPRAAHRWRAAVLVTFHLAAGLVTAVLLVGLIPGAVVLARAGVRGQPAVFAGVGLPALSPAGGVLLVVATVVGCLAGAWGLGRLAAAVASPLLGPTAADRLEVALARLATESEHTRLARDLHDGIGHALSIVSVQAAAGRRTLGQNPYATEAALETIESTARVALTELDAMLGLIRDGSAGTPPAGHEPGLDQLPALVAAYRSAGMELTAELETVDGLPRLVSSTAFRIVGEALTNAERHGGPGSVTLRLSRTRAGLAIEARNPGAATSTGDPTAERVGVGRAGHGLRGAGERAALFGGTFRAGPEGSEWVLRAEIPIGPAGA